MAAKFADSNAYSSLESAIASFHVAGSHASPNRFEVLILSPPKMSGAPTTNPYFGSERNSDARAVSLRCETISLPGRSLNVEEDTNIYGPSREIVKGATYAGDLALTFQSSAELEERIFFEEWQKQSFDESSWNVGYYNDYVSTIEIYLLDRQNKRRYGVKLIEAYPKEIGPVDLGQSLNSEVIKLSVSFAYRYWTTLDMNRQASLGPMMPDISSNRIINANMPKVLTILT